MVTSGENGMLVKLKMMCWQVGKITNWQNGMLVKQQIDVLPSWQNGMLAKWQVDETANRCTNELAK